MPDRPNILLVVTDQQSSAMLSCAGNPHLHTPALDRLAAGGTRFARAYCTNPVCCPSRLSLFTGRMPSAIGMRGITPPQPREPLPGAVLATGAGRLLTAAGYRCVYGGKEHLPRTDAPGLGFERLTRDERDGLADAAAGFLAAPGDRPFFLVTSFVNPHDICYMAIRDFCETDHAQTLVERGQTECRTLDEALARPAGAEDDATFFSTHCPPLPANFEPQADEPEALSRMLAERNFRERARDQWPERRWREHRWAYARLTERVDAQIGRVLDGLERSGRADDTIVIFTSDHGDMDAAHRMEHKSAFYDESARVPLIVRDPAGPAAAAGAVNGRDLVSNGLDLVPTLCDYAGAPVPDHLAGRSMRPLLKPAEPSPARPWVPIENTIGRCIVSATHKYRLYDRGAGREQLVDLATDPGEMRNAAGDPEQADALERHRRWFAEAFGAGT